MQSSPSHTILSATVTVAFLAACGGSGSVSGVPGAASTVGAAQSRLGQDGVSLALSGEYTGKFYINGQGTLKVKLFLSQSQNALGGVLVKDGPSKGAIAGAIAWNVSGNAISGNAIASPGSGSGLCTFAMTATRKYRRISGSYSAPDGCSRQTGTFNLWHKCYVPNTGGEVIRPETRVKPC